MALIIGSQYTFTDVKWLGVCEIVLGLLAALIPELGLIFWAIGFGILHILYGSIMHFKYNQSLEQFDKAFENRIRLQIMSVLVANESYDFNSLKELLQVTDGNLASHLKALDKEKYIMVNKSFIGRKPNTQYSATKAGREAFKKHLEALENLIKQQKL